MTARSERHHEVPKWLLRHFCWDNGKMLWMGSKDTREITRVSLRDAFVRRNANTRTEYQSRGDGTFQQVKSDPDETILANFDGQASGAARELIDFSRLWRDAGQLVPRFHPKVAEDCKRLIVAQARRTWESQNRLGISEGMHELCLDLYLELAEEVGQQLPCKEELLKDPRVTDILDALSKNHRANLASGNHSILADKEEEFLAPLGLHVAVIDETAAEFVIGSHGITIVETADGRNTWLPLAPDVAISFSDRPGGLSIASYEDQFVELHNRAALSISARVAGRSKGTIEGLLAELD